MYRDYTPFICVLCVVSTRLTITYREVGRFVLTCTAIVNHMSRRLGQNIYKATLLTGCSNTVGGKYLSAKVWGEKIITDKSLCDKYLYEL